MPDPAAPNTLPQYLESMLSLLLIQTSLLLTPLSGGTSNASSSEPLDGVTAQEEAKPGHTWSGTADVAITDVSGNSESSNAAVNLGLRWEGELDAVGLGVHYAGVRTTDKLTGDASTTTRLYQYDLDYNRFFSTEKNLYGYLNGAMRQDEPNGLQQRTSGGLGGGYRFHIYEGGDLNLEGGASYVSENKIGTVNETSAVGRAAFNFVGPWTEHLQFTATGEYLSGTTIESYVQDLGLTWTFSDNWRLTLSQSIAWDGNPSPGFSTTDRRWNLLIGTSF